MVVVQDESENYLTPSSREYSIAQMLSARSFNLKQDLELLTAESGQATVEFALVLPFLFLFSMAIVQVGSVANDQLALGHAARAAARAISLGDITSENANQVAFSAVENAITLENIDIQVELDESLARVTLTYERQISLPIIGDLIDDLTLHSSVSMPRELTS